MDFVSKKNRILSAKQSSDQIIQRLSERRYCSEMEVVSAIHRFTLLRFMLSEEEVQDRDLKLLAEKSVEKTIERYGKNYADDAATSCEGVTSAVKKKILLLIAIQRELHISFPLERITLLNTTDAIGQEVYRLLEQ